MSGGYAHLGRERLEELTMAPVALARVAEATSSQAAGRTASLAREVIGLLPWSGNLPAEDFAEMLVELHRAAVAWRRTGDLAELERLTAEWQATAEAYGNAGLLEQLARRDKTY